MEKKLKRERQECTKLSKEHEFKIVQKFKKKRKRTISIKKIGFQEKPQKILKEKRSSFQWKI